MTSPLHILVELSPEALITMGVGLVLLAERICTFGPRVSRKRKQELLEAAVYDEIRKDVLSGRADTLALRLLQRGPSTGPEHIDFLDLSAEDEDLEFVDPEVPE